MNIVEIRRGEKAAIPFSVTDANNGLLNKRLTLALSPYLGGPRTLRKESGMGASSAQVIFAPPPTAGLMTGHILIEVDDYAILSDSRYYASLWVDSGSEDDRCAVPGDQLDIVPTVAREASP